MMLVPYFDKYVRRSQCGGFSKRGTDFATQHVRTMMSISSIRRKPLGLIVIDVIGAFDSLSRELVVACMATPGDAEHVIRALSLNPECADQVRRICSGVAKSVLDDAGVPKQLQVMVAQLHHSIWFSTQGTSSVMHTEQGSRPGNSLGDIMFNFLVTRLMNQLERELDENKLLDELPRLTNHPCVNAFRDNGLLDGVGHTCLIDVDYCDDCVLLVWGSSGPDLLDKLPRVLTCMHQVFTANGLPIDFNAGKTEIPLSLHGKGSKKTYQALIDRGHVVSFTPYINTHSIDVKVVEQYKHMGVIITCNGSSATDMAGRASIAHETVNGLRCSVFSSPRSEMPVKVSLVGSFVHTRLLYCAQLWTQYDTNAFRRIKAARIRSLRVASGMINVKGARITDEEVLEQTQSWYTEDVVRRIRLAYWRRLLLSNQCVLRYLLVATSGRNRSWLGMILEDMSWLKCCLPRHLE